MSLRSELAEQPTVVRRLLAAAWPEARDLGRRLARTEHLTIAARGSSDNAATYGKYLFEALAGVVTALAAPSLVTRYRSAPQFARGGVIGISQSGAAPDVAAVLAEARQSGAVTLAITNRAGSPLARAAERTFLLRAGPERAVAATKTYTATCVALALIATTLAEARERSALSLAGLEEAMDEAVGLERETARLARALGRARQIVVLGRGFEFASALECALKIKELARVWAEPYSSADFLHGPIAVVGRATPVVLFAARGATSSEARATLGRLRRRKARVYAVTNDPALAARADGAVLLERPLSEALTPITFAVAAQLLAIDLARSHGLDPDRPAGLSKVTRTR